MRTGFSISIHEKYSFDGQTQTEIGSRGWTKGTKQRSEPFGVARAACFERLAGVFASRVASLATSPVSQSRTGQENRLFSAHRGRCLNSGQKFGLFSGRRRLKVVRGQEKGHFYLHHLLLL